MSDGVGPGSITLAVIFWCGLHSSPTCSPACCLFFVPAVNSVFFSGSLPRSHRLVLYCTVLCHTLQLLQLLLDPVSLRRGVAMKISHTPLPHRPLELNPFIQRLGSFFLKLASLRCVLNQSLRPMLILDFEACECVASRRVFSGCGVRSDPTRPEWPSAGSCPAPLVGWGSLAVACWTTGS